MLEFMKESIGILIDILGFASLSVLPIQLYYDRKCKKLHSEQKKGTCRDWSCRVYPFCKYAATVKGLRMREEEEDKKNSPGRIPGQK